MWPSPNCEDELRAWDQQFSWGDDSPGTFFFSLAMQRWITMRMSLMQQYFFARISDLPQADFTLFFPSDELFAAWQALEGKFQREFQEFLTKQGFEPMAE
jgi:DNA-directed RNA polymerase specialized sigma24 family protein